MGLKSLGVDGPKLPDDKAVSTSFDLGMIKTPVFAANNAATYFHIQRVSFEQTDYELWWLLLRLPP